MPDCVGVTVEVEETAWVAVDVPLRDCTCENDPVLLRVCVSVGLPVMLADVDSLPVPDWVAVIAWLDDPLSDGVRDDVWVRVVLTERDCV